MGLGTANHRGHRVKNAVSSVRSRPRVWLGGLSRGLGLIVLHPSGVLIGNQTNGIAVGAPFEEGVFVPLLEQYPQQLTKHFLQRYDYTFDGIDEHTADFVDKILEEAPQTRFLRVNRYKLKLSHEAWVYVLGLKDCKSDWLTYVSGFPGDEGVLTWPNSD